MAASRDPLPPESIELFHATDDLIAEMQRVVAEWRSITDALDPLRDADGVNGNGS